MPNWCFTEIAFYGKNKEEVSIFRNNIVTAIKTLPIERNESNRWEGRVARFLNIPIEGKRGFITEVSEIEEIYIEGSLNYHFVIFEEYAWSYDVSMWEDLIKALEIDIDFVFIAEENSCDLYVNTDVNGYFFAYNYVVDSEEDCLYFEDWESALKYLKKINSAFENCTTFKEASDIAYNLVYNEEVDYLKVAEFCDA